MTLGQSLATALLLVPLVGCMDAQTLIHVRSDGSGYIREQVVMNKALVNSVRAMAKQFEQFEGEKTPGQSFELIDEDTLRRKAGDMGDGVYFISARRVFAEAGEGYKAYYGFSDINTVRINQNPGNRAPAADPGPGAALGGGGTQREFLTFRLIPGNPAELVITAPAHGAFSSEPDSSGTGPDAGSPDELQTQEILKQMQQIFEGLRVVLNVEVEGEIVDTNATYVTGSRVTLMELDFGKLLEMPHRLRDFAARKPKGIADAKALMIGIPGIKVDVSPEVRITFEQPKLRET